jgi:hypothetical protein
MMTMVEVVVASLLLDARLWSWEERGDYVVA